MSLPQPPETPDAPGPVPADNQPGHHPSKEQDKPDLTAFARRLGVVDEPAETTTGAGESRGRTKLVVASAVAAVLAALGVGLVLRRRSRRR